MHVPKKTNGMINNKCKTLCDCFLQCFKKSKVYETETFNNVDQLCDGVIPHLQYHW